MTKLYLYFSDVTLNSVGPPEELVIETKESDLNEFILHLFLNRIGERSMAPFFRDGQQVYLAFIADESGKKIFYNAHNF